MAILYLGNCAQKPEPIRQWPSCVPNLVSVEVDNHSMVVSFRVNCDQRLKSGYNIYITEESLAGQYPDSNWPDSVEPHNHPVFPGDLNPEDEIERYEAEGLKNGVPYFVSVRTVFADQSESKPSRELVAICGPRGELVLSQRYSSDQDGFSFMEEHVVRADGVENDLYYYSSNGDHFLASPTRLDGFLRESRFEVLPFSGDFEEVSTKVLTLSTFPEADRVEVDTGDWVWVVTADGYSALLHVLGFEGTGENRRIRLYYAFTPSRGMPLF